VLLLRLGGNAERVDSEQSEAATLGGSAVVGTDVWRAVRQCERSCRGAVVIRWSQMPSLVAATWRHALECCAGCPDALIHASLARGVVRAIIPAADPSSDAGALARVLGAGGRSFEGRRIAERLPAALWSAEPPAGGVDRLSRRVRLAFDPWHILNPGILGEGLRNPLGSP
jgi:FAD/FMN-containing dehydrogenase